MVYIDLKDTFYDKSGLPIMPNEQEWQYQTDRMSFESKKKFKDCRDDFQRKNSTLNFLEKIEESKLNMFSRPNFSGLPKESNEREPILKIKKESSPIINFNKFFSKED